MHSAFYPTGCTYEVEKSSVGRYKCDYTTSQSNFPIRYTNFSEPFPQRVVLYGINGMLPQYATFDGWDGFNYTYQNNDHKNSLELICTDGGSLQWGVGTFTWMYYLHEVHIRGCTITNGLISSAFSDFRNLDHLIIEGCSIPSTATDTFSGLNITKMDNIPDAVGQLTIKDCTVTGGNFSVGFFDLLTQVNSIDISNNGMANLDVNMFSQLAKVTHIKMGNNPYTTIPNNLFYNNSVLYRVDFSGILWDCSCDNLWFIEWMANNYIEIEGAVICNTPAAVTGLYIYM